MNQVILVLTLFLIGCTEMNLVDLSNDGRIFKTSEIYDCRVQARHPWGDSPHTELITHLIDIKNKKEILHKGYYKDTILNSVYEYKLKSINTEIYEFIQYVYDIEEVEETNNFIRFFVVDEDDNKARYVINKSDMTLSPIKSANKKIGVSLTSDWKRPCKKI